MDWNWPLRLDCWTAPSITAFLSSSSLFGQDVRGRGTQRNQRAIRSLLQSRPLAPVRPDYRLMAAVTSVIAGLGCVNPQHTLARLQPHFLAQPVCMPGRQEGSTRIEIYRGSGDRIKQIRKISSEMICVAIFATLRSRYFLKFSWGNATPGYNKELMSEPRGLLVFHAMGFFSGMWSPGRSLVGVADSRGEENCRFFARETKLQFGIV